MRAVLQRVSEASVTVDGQVIGEIGKGVMVLFGMLGTDDDKTIDYMLDKIINLRIFEDENGKISRFTAMRRRDAVPGIPAELRPMLQGIYLSGSAQRRRKRQ